MNEITAPDDAAHEALREMLGEHALGLLPADERAVLEDHLAGCAECRAELAELADLAPLLRQVDPDRVTAAPVDPVPELTPELEAAIHARMAGAPATRGEDQVAAPSHDDLVAPVVPLRPRRRVATLLAAAAALLLVGGVGGWLLAPRPPDVPFEPVTVAVAGGTASEDLDVTAGLIPHTWGVEVRMTASGFTAGEHYVVQVVDEDGNRRDAGEFVGTGEKPMVCNLNSSVLRAEATGFVVLDEEQRTVASSRF